MSESAPARPPQVTMAAWVTMLGSAFVVFGVFEVVANIRSLDTRERVEGSLGEPPLEGLGFSVEQVLGLLHVASLVAAGCATAAVILGWQVLRRSRSARLALSILVVPLFLSGIVTGGFLSSMVAVSVLLLWTRPARDWFDGIAYDARAARTAGLFGGAPPGGRPSGGQAPGAQPPGVAPPGPQPPDGPSLPESPPAPGGWPAPTPAPYAGFGEGQGGPPGPRRRPPQVVQACLLAWMFSGVVLVSLVVALGALLADPSFVETVYREDPRFSGGDLSPATLRAGTVAVSVIFAVWSMAAIVLATWTFLGRNGARIGLLVSSAVAGLLTLVMTFALPVMALVALACLATILMLTRPASNDWFARRPPG